MQLLPPQSAAAAAPDLSTLQPACSCVRTYARGQRVRSAAWLALQAYAIGYGLVASPAVELEARVELVLEGLAVDGRAACKAPWHVAYGMACTHAAQVNLRRRTRGSPVLHAALRCTHCDGRAIPLAQVLFNAAACMLGV